MFTNDSVEPFSDDEFSECLSVVRENRTFVCRGGKLEMGNVTCCASFWPCPWGTLVFFTGFKLCGTLDASGSIPQPCNRLERGAARPEGLCREPTWPVGSGGHSILCNMVVSICWQDGFFLACCIRTPWSVRSPPYRLWWSGDALEAVFEWRQNVKKRQVVVNFSYSE